MTHTHDKHGTQYAIRETVINGVRSGALIPEEEMECVRYSLRMNGWEMDVEDFFGDDQPQQDAGELFMTLLDKLEAPSLGQVCYLSLCLVGGLFFFFFFFFFFWRCSCDCRLVLCTFSA